MFPRLISQQVYPILPFLKAMPLQISRTFPASNRLPRLRAPLSNHTEAEYRRRLAHLLRRSIKINLTPILTSILFSLLCPLVRYIHLQLHHLRLSHRAETPSHLRTRLSAHGAILTELRCLRTGSSKPQADPPLHSPHCLLYLHGTFLTAILVSPLPAPTTLIPSHRLSIITTLFRLPLARPDLHRRNIHLNA